MGKKSFNDDYTFDRNRNTRKIQIENRISKIKNKQVVDLAHCQKFIDLVLLHNRSYIYKIGKRNGKEIFRRIIDTLLLIILIFLKCIHT